MTAQIELGCYLVALVLVTVGCLLIAVPLALIVAGILVGAGAWRIAEGNGFDT